MRFSFVGGLLVSIGGFSLLSCAQVLGLGDYKEGSDSGGNGTSTGAPAAGPTTSSASGTGDTGSASTTGAGGTGPAPGEVLWAKSFGDAGEQEAARVAVSPSGQIYVVMRDTVPFGNGSVIALSSTGEKLWSSTQAFGAIYGIAADDSGVVIAGMNQGFYMAKLDPSGTLKWKGSCNGTAGEPAIDDAGDVVMDGMSNSTFVGNVGDVGCAATSAIGLVGITATPNGALTRGIYVQNTPYTALGGLAGNAQGAIAVGIPSGSSFDKLHS